MRKFVSIVMLAGVVGLALASPLAGVAQTVPPPEQSGLEVGFARPGGTYLTPPASSAEACAQACSQDTLCMAFTFYTYESAPRCELKAVIPRPRPDPAAIAGLSHRAPAFARLVSGERQPEAPAPPPLPLIPPEATAVAAIGTAVPNAAPAAAPEPAPEPEPEPVAAPVLATAPPAVPVLAQTDAPILLTPPRPESLPLRERLPATAR